MYLFAGVDIEYFGNVSITRVQNAGISLIVFLIYQYNKK